jgi:hypothetical protein
MNSTRVIDIIDICILLLILTIVLISLMTMTLIFLEVFPEDSTKITVCDIIYYPDASRPATNEAIENKDWLYKPDTDCWYGKGSSFSNDICEIVRDFDGQS